VNPGGVSIFKHVTVFQCGQAPKLIQTCKTIGSLSVARYWYSAAHTSSLILAANVRRPKWASQDSIIDSRHDVFLLVYRPNTKRLFIAATDRKPGYYNALVEFYVDGQARKLSLEEMKKVLSGFKDLIHHNVGVKNISPGSSESYRIMAGSGADRSLAPGDARMYRQGHFMGRGTHRGQLESIGASSTSRTWGSGYLRIPEFLRYVEDVDSRLGSTVPIAKSGLDYLPVGKTLTSIPADTMAGEWSKAVRRDLPRARWSESGSYRYCDLVDLEFYDFRVLVDQQSMRFAVKDDTASLDLRFRLGQTPAVVPDMHSEKLSVQISSDEWAPISAWLSEHPPRFFTAKCEAFEGQDLLGTSVPAGGTLMDGDVLKWDWTGCEIDEEFDLSNPARPTIHMFLRKVLLADAQMQVILYDHRSGELADYVAISSDSHNRVTIHLYHCKKAGGAPSGARTDDVTELVLQAVKCLQLLSKEAVLSHVRRRTSSSRTHQSIFVRGDAPIFEKLLAEVAPIDLLFDIYAVQPGILPGQLQPTLSEPMAAAVSYVNKIGTSYRLRWITNG
jgi:hypothetical protein